MHIDHSDALVKFTIEGLFVICKRIHPASWVLGVPNVPIQHNLSIKIREITGDGTPNPIPPSDLPGLDLNRSIEIVPDVSTELTNYESPEFPNDHEDSRWIIDLESGKFHPHGVEARPVPNSDNPSARRHYKTNIFIAGGVLYTTYKTVLGYKRVRRQPPNDELVLGKVAVTVGLDLPRIGDGKFIKIRNVVAPTNEIALVQRPGVRYEVSLKHVCPDGTPPRPRPDFDLYYTILQARDGTRFDLVEHPPLPVIDLPSGGEEPQVCNAVLLGQTLQPPGETEA
jgi:hypothetical protein